MRKINSLLPGRSVAILIVFITVILLLMANHSSQAIAPEAPTDYFVCTPQQVGTFSNRVHVRCVPSAPNNIVYFAVCSAGNANFAARALRVCPFLTLDFGGWANLGVRFHIKFYL